MGRSLVSTGGRGSGGRDTGSSRGHDSGIYVSSSVGDAGPNSFARHVDTTETHESDVVAESSRIHQEPNTGTQVPNEPSQKPRLEIEGLDFTEAEVGRKATKLLKDSFMGPWTTWRDVDSESRAILFERFKVSCDVCVEYLHMDDDIDGLVRLVWGAALNKRWKNMMHDERDYAIERARDAGVVFDGSNYEVLIPFGPSWIHQDYWRDMVRKKWNTIKWKKRVEIGKKNQKAVPEGKISKHTGGCISMVQRRWRIEQKERRKPTAIELFEMTHKTKGSGESSVSGTGQSEISRDEKFVDDYQREMIKKYGPDVSTHPLGDIEVWEHCAGGRKRGRLFGVGTCGDPSYVVTGSSSGNRSYASSSFSEVRELKEKLQKIEEERAIEREENIRMSKRLKDIEAMLARRYPPSPSEDPASRNPR
ncbi:hypothetical protein OSB04_016454 [Centaurea solstitialis]|uniref:Transposase, Ptta/En/Spm, plant n=1 Tax=Centaurea solstitialis TaxID=347529 RepID=A0AA38WJQ8_9ASTR|nr:hypothetical protein OSB04_016454 [Centaurea solstitialis]